MPEFLFIFRPVFNEERMLYQGAAEGAWSLDIAKLAGYLADHTTVQF